MLVSIFTDSLDRELVESAVFATQLNHARAPSARAIRIVQGIGGNLALLVMVCRLEAARGCAIWVVGGITSLEMGWGLVMEVRKIRKNLVLSGRGRNTSPLDGAEKS
jgi:hypothetical protein